ncbi:S-adenosyl-L-methionine-dependent methyltransferase [Mycena rosella]|uniref:DNA (cytosine-5-)-methyltransferase n=1 Tax=Mycena rosella TaxID=1033263 RepID=A0AAD7GBY9_MYCRO|nr:S-adenosyl-L-methionine-dependent methyltransferase [Mycena rosella]
MAPPRRPSAWEVSFPEEAMAELAALQISQPANEPATQKRKAADDEERDAPQRATKRSQLLNVAHYKPPRKFVVESASFVAPGEDREPEDSDRQEKPFRVLSNFCIFDPANNNEFVLLDALEPEIDDDGRQAQSRFSAAGVVLLADEDDEDYGQEDGADPGEGDHVRLDHVTLCPTDYFARDAAVTVCVETDFAFYELRGPSTRYNPYLVAFAAPRRVACAILLWARAHPREGLQRFREGARAYSDEDLAEAAPYIREVVDEQGGTLQRAPLIVELLHKSPGSDRGPRRRTRAHRAQPRRNQPFIGDPDLALLKSENQSPTHVTPLIAALADGYFEETLQVLGAPPKAPSKADTELQKANTFRLLKHCIAKIRSQEHKKPAFTAVRSRYGPYVEEATIGGEVYRTGDFVCIRKGHYRGVPAPLMVQICDVPEDASLPDYFWLARLIYFNSDTQMAHIQWLEHGSQIILGEMAHPQELFLNVLCENQKIEWIAGKISVVYSMDAPRKQEQYFMRTMYDERDASFTSLDQAEMNRIFNNPPPDNCLPCSRSEVYNNNSEWHFLDEYSAHGKGRAGVAYQGRKYHVHEFFLYRNHDGGPAHIGYVKHVQQSRRGRDAPRIVACKVGRMQSGEYPERHVFLTHEEVFVPVDELVQPIHVYARDFFPDLAELKRWVDYSPYHFYCSYRLLTVGAEPHAGSSTQREEVASATLNICQFCPSDRYLPHLREEEFQAEQENQRYDCLDLFGGTGAFSQAVAEGSRGCLKPTHLIEITPSAAKTAQKNSNVAVYCQDANVVLRYFVKSHAKQNVEVPLQLFDNTTPVPAPLKPGNMGAIFIGLPCQSHSGLNMYRKAEDPKSNLMLTAASYIDFFRPNYVFLENVPGFLKYNLLAQQVDRHRLEGGIEMGGLKLLIRALIDMKYTLRFSLLQAGNYGAPQSRVRFFLVAAHHGLELPQMPQPTHDFEVVNQLKIKLPYNHKPSILPIRTTRGTMPHGSVSIEDAIGDLPQFDWKHPDPKNASQSLRKVLDRRAREGIPAYPCEREKNHCGLEGVVAYRHEPRTSFQREARERPTENIQHITRCLLPKTVERVVTVPLEPGADFRSLPDRLAEWQFFSPVSAVGRNKYRGGLYGRLDKAGYFPTTVTNMHPTAKQSKVLHPDCLRMVTVRELARSQGFADWFVFISVNNNVVTLHRQIGNAVPWQVSRALGRELRAALFKKWREEKKKASAAADAGDEDEDDGVV